MVKNIEELRSELKVDPFGKVELPAYCEIQLINGKSSQRVASQRSLTRCKRSYEWTNLWKWIAWNRDASVV